MLQMPTSGDRKQEKSKFLVNGYLFFLDLLSHRRPPFSNDVGVCVCLYSLDVCGAEGDDRHDCDSGDDASSSGKVRSMTARR